MKAYWSNEIEESHGEILILSVAKKILLQEESRRINSDIEFEEALINAINKAAQADIFERTKWSTIEENYESFKEFIAEEPDFFGNEYYAKLNAGLPESKIDIDGILESRNMALLGELLAEVVIDNPSIDLWSNEYIAKLLDDIEIEIAEETLARKHL